MNAQPTGTVDPKLLGFVEDEKVSVSSRYWDGVRRTLGRLLTMAAQIVRECDEMLAICKHAPGCAGAEHLTEPCGPDCPDREYRLSFAVMRANAAQFAGRFVLPKPNTEGILLPVARETLDAIIGELELLRQRDDWRKEAEAHRLEMPPHPESGT